MKTLIVLVLAFLFVTLPMPCNIGATTWIVDDPGDPTPTPPGTLTLRQALSNAIAGDRIWFSLQLPYTISLQGSLPPITQNHLMIDGYSQPGNPPSSPGSSPPSTAVIRVKIDGTNAGSAHGFWIMASFDTIQGLAIVNFEKDGIRIEGTPWRTHHNFIYGNFIGTDTSGTLGQGNGIQPIPSNIWAGVDILCPPGSPTPLYCHHNFVEGNLISDNHIRGVQIAACPPSSTMCNVVIDNYIGTDITGMNGLGNHGTGVCIVEGACSNYVDVNVISDNYENGVDICGNPLVDSLAYRFTRHNFVRGNKIGLAVDGVSQLSNVGFGVSIGVSERARAWCGYASANEIGPGNAIAYNGSAGVRVWEHGSNNANADSNRIDANLIYDNGGLGIDLWGDGVTPNDSADLDSGPNQELNYPVIMSADDTSGTATITGYVDIPSPQLATVQVFRARTDPTGFGEGDLYLGFAQPNASGNWTAVVSGLVPNDSVTATVIDVSNNTSEFSAVAAVQYADSSILVVDDVGDPNPINPGGRTLRSAIQAAEDDPNENIIIFRIAGSGVHTISLASPLPAITQDSLLIAGYTQSGASPGDSPLHTTIMIEVDGSGAGPGPGFWIKASQIIIEGLAIMSFEQDGIRIEGTPDSTAHNTIWGNFIGTDASGAVAAGNGTDTTGTWAGISILCTEHTTYCHDNVIDNNLIADNRSAGIRVAGNPPSKVYNNQIVGNYIGTTYMGLSAMANHGTGVCLDRGTCLNLIDSNVISGNAANGVDIVGYAHATAPAFTSGNVVSNNYVGVGYPVPTPVGNSGCGISIGVREITGYYGGFATGNQVSGNRIAKNNSAGIRVWEHALSASNADSNRITQNAMYDNGGLGIDLGDDGVTPNDSADVDTGPNQQQNYPVITSALEFYGTTTVTGTLGSTPASSVERVEVFYAWADPTGFGEGRYYLGFAVPDSAGNWTTDVGVVDPGDAVTATAISVCNNTSEFSDTLLVEQDIAGLKEAVGGPVGFSLALEGVNPFHSQTPIRYTVGCPGRVTVKIYGVSGKLLRTLADRFMEEGVYRASWDGTTDHGEEVSSGLYFVELRSGSYKEFIKVLRLR